MNNLVSDLKAICEEASQMKMKAEILRIKLKEKLQIYALDFIYNNPNYNHLVMYGGTSLRICYDLGRMSEDIDFETTTFFDKKKFASDIKDYFAKKIQYPDLTTHIPGQRIGRVELRFPVLFELGLSLHKEENLILKIEVNQIEKNYTTALKPMAEGQFSFVIRHYILQVLMAGKISACLTRIWEKRGVKIKGRDYFDLLWYMGKRIIPDSSYLAGKGYSIFKAFKELKEKMDLIKPEDVLADIRILFENPNFAERWTEIMKEQFATLSEKYQTAPISEKPEFDVSQNKKFDAGIFSIAVKCLNEMKREINLVFLFSKEWMDDEGHKLQDKNRLEELCRIKVKEYLKEEDNGNNIVPARYETKIIATLASRKDDDKLIRLTLESFEKISFKELIEKKKMYVSF